MAIPESGINSPSNSDDDEQEQDAVSTNPLTGEIVVRFGQLEPIEIPSDVAIQFALLLLKQSGVVLKQTQRGFIAIYGAANERKTHRGH